MLLPLLGLLFTISCKDRMAHTMAFVIQVMEDWLEQEIVQWVHHDGSSNDSLHHEWTLYHRATCCSMSTDKVRTVYFINNYTHTNVISFNLAK